MEKRYCQSCGMPLTNPDWLGTNSDNSKSNEYCYYCLKNGKYVVDVSMEEMINIWIKYSDEFNNYSNSKLSKKEIGILLRKRLPQLKRWEQKNTTVESYHRAINQVIAYINEHLFEALDLKSLAEIANLSKFHFHRIFRAITDESIGEYIQRLRLEFVAHKLSTTDLPLVQIAEQTNYKSIHALSKAFKNHFRMAPSVYRKQSRETFQYNARIRSEDQDMTTRITQVKDLNIIYLNIGRAYCSPTAYKKVWQKLTDFAEKARLTGESNKFVSISFDDPTITPAEQCRFYIGITVQSSIKPKGKFGVMAIPNGEYAVFRFKGEYATLPNLYRYIYLKWLPESNYQLRNTFSFEIYINTPKDTSPPDLLTDIYIPVEKPGI